MKILYGVVGEGMGHATRSKVTLQYLVSQGHQVKVVVSGRAYDFLRKSFDDVTEIVGLEMKYVDGAMDRDGSVLKNVLKVPGMVIENVGAYLEDARKFGPDAIISDFESFAYMFGRAHGVPILSIDNQQIISRCIHDPQITEGHQVDFQSTKAFIKLKLPNCEHYAITTFFYPEIKAKYQHNTTLVPSILRQSILDAKRSQAGHVLVYQTSTSDTRLVDTLNTQSQQKFIVYGLRRDEVRGNCVIKNFSEQGFVDDLASANAVIANGGLSLIGEALYLGKPVLSVPVKHQFEQVMNARYITKLGYGMSSPEFEEATLAAFLQDYPHFARKVQSSYKQDGNSLLFKLVDENLARFAAKSK